MIIHIINTISLQNIKNPPIWCFETILSIKALVKLQRLLFYVRPVQTKVIFHI